MTSEKRVVPRKIVEVHKFWDRLAILLRGFHIFLVIVATSFSVFASIGLGKTLSIKWLPAGVDPLAAISAIAIALFSTFDVGKKANNVRSAWRLLNAAMIRFEEEPDYTTEKLIQAYEQAEKLIGDVSASPIPPR